MCLHVSISKRSLYAYLYACIYVPIFIVLVIFRPVEMHRE